MRRIYSRDIVQLRATRFATNNITLDIHPKKRANLKEKIVFNHLLRQSGRYSVNL